MPRGAVALFADLEREFDTAELDLSFVVNERYAERCSSSSSTPAGARPRELRI